VGDAETTTGAELISCGMSEEDGFILHAASRHIRIVAQIRLFIEFLLETIFVCFEYSLIEAIITRDQPMYLFESSLGSLLSGNAGACATKPA
jgi:hypothetical protein